MANDRLQRNPGLQRMPQNQQEWTHYQNELAKWVTKTFRQAAQPSGITVGDIWIDSDDGEKQYRWDGTAWVAVRDTTIATAQTAADTAQTDLEANNVTVEGLSQQKWTDSAGTWPADDSDDHVLSFLRSGSSIATHTIRAVFTQSTGNWTVTSQAETGEATVETITGSGGKDSKAVVSHTGSGIVGKVTLQSLDQSAAGGAPSK